MKVNVPILYVTGWLEPPLKMCCGPNPQYLWMWPFLERGSADVKKRRWGLQGGPWPSMALKRRRRDADTHVTTGTGVGWCSTSPGAPRVAGHTRSWRRQGRVLPAAFRGSPALPAPWPQTLGLQTVRQALLLFSSPQFVGLCYGSPRRLIQCIINKLRKQMIKYRISSF